MKKSQFKTRLKRAVAWDQVPQLSEEEVDDLVELARTHDAYGHPAESIEEWEPSTLYEAGQMVVTPKKELFSCVADGTSGSTFPTHVRGQGEVVDGSTLWVYQGRSNYTPTYNLNYAANEGWGMKAAKAASMISFSADGARFDRDQLIANCERMQRKYPKVSSARMRGSTRVVPMILEVVVDGND